MMIIFNFLYFSRIFVTDNGFKFQNDLNVQHNVQHNDFLAIRQLYCKI